MDTKVCKMCNTELPLTKEYFYPNGYTPKGTKKWKPTCKACEKADKVESYEKLISDLFPNMACNICGYNKCKNALEFHHIDPQAKEYSIASFRYTPRNKEVMIAELKKCVLLCANCHREVHAGVTKI